MFGTGRYRPPSRKQAMENATQWNYQRTLTEPSKTHLRDILAEAVRNTAQPQKTNPRVPDGQGRA